MVVLIIFTVILQTVINVIMLSVGRVRLLTGMVHLSAVQVLLTRHWWRPVCYD